MAARLLTPLLPLLTYATVTVAAPYVTVAVTVALPCVTVPYVTVTLTLTVTPTSSTARCMEAALGVTVTVAHPTWLTLTLTAGCLHSTMESWHSRLPRPLPLCCRHQPQRLRHRRRPQLPRP
jgi:hypothetical protein